MNVSIAPRPSRQRMNQSDFKTWLTASYPHGRRLNFVADYNQVAEPLGARPVSAALINHWMHDRQPPAQVAGMPFDRFLALVLERRGAQQPATTYLVHLAVDEPTKDALEEIAANGTSVEDFLRCVLLAAVEDEVSIHHKAAEKRRKLKEKSCPKQNLM